MVVLTVLVVCLVDNGIEGVRVSTIIPSLVDPLNELGTTSTDVPTMTWLPIVIPIPSMLDDATTEVNVAALLPTPITLPSPAAVTVAVTFPIELVVVTVVAVFSIFPATSVVTTTFGQRS